MFRSILVIVFTALQIPGNSNAAEEYLVHVEKFGYEEAIVIDDEFPKAVMMDSLQIGARPGVPFYGRTGTRGNFMKAKGQMDPDPAGGWKLEVHYTESQERMDSSVVMHDGIRIMGRSSQAVDTTVTVKLGHSTQIGGKQQTTISMQDGKEVNRQTKFEVRSRITEFKPDEMTPEEAEVFDLERLCRGSWSAIKLVNDGATADENLVKAIGFRFGADRLHLAGPEPRLGARRFEFQLDTASSPRAMRLTALDGRWKGQSVTALYDLSSGDLHMCIPEFGTEGRPAGLEAPSGSKLKFIVLDKD